MKRKQISDRAHARCRVIHATLIIMSVLVAVCLTAVSAFATPLFTGSFAGSGTNALVRPLAVGVDQSTHDLYVADQATHRIEKFDSAGNFILMFGRHVDETTNGDVCTAASGDTCQEGSAAGGDGSPAGAFNEPAFITIDNSGGASDGDVYVGDRNTTPGVVQKFTASGELITTWGDSSPSPNGQLTGMNATAPIAGPFSGLAGIAVDGSGHLWVDSNNRTVGESQMFEFGEDGSFLTDWASEKGVDEPPPGIAADQAGNVFLITGAVGIAKFTASGTLVGVIDEKYNNLFGIALNPATDELYVDDGTEVHQYASCVECEPIDQFGAGILTKAQGLAFDAIGKAQLIYVADTGNARVDIFSPPGPPSITSVSAIARTPTTAELTAVINPNGTITTAHFEYGTTTSYGTVVPDKIIGSGTSGQTMFEPLAGLQPNVTYHYRVVATNALGTTFGSDQTFSYPIASGGPDTCSNAAVRSGLSHRLPDCRAYELVTPPFKAGENVHALPYLDGSNAIFSMLGAVGNAEDNPTASGTSYLATRAAVGWTSTSLDPPAALVDNEGGLSETFAAVSTDFQTALFQAPAAASKPIDVRLYLRHAGGVVTEVGPVTSPQAVAAWTPGVNLNEKPSPAYLGASADLSHIVFRRDRKSPTELNWYWPGDTTVIGQSLYEWVGAGHTGAGADVPSLVGVDSAHHQITQCGTFLGGEVEGTEKDTTNAISTDGSMIFFTAAPGGAASCTGSGPPAAEVFASVDGTLPDAHTVAISEPSQADCFSCDVSSPKDATYAGASPDGTRAFFVTRQPLLGSDATQNLYEYDSSAPAGQRIIHVSVGDPAGANVLGVVRTSPDGSHIYFVASGVLTAAANTHGQTAKSGKPNLYWYDTASGHMTFVTVLGSADSANWTTDAGLRPAEATRDGRFLLFTSSNDLTPDASGTSQQLYRYDSVTGELIRVSIGDLGYNNNGNIGSNNVHFTNAAAGRTGAVAGGVFMSEDGAYVFFESSAGLTPEALDNVRVGEQPAMNIYEYHDGRVFLISDGKDRNLILGGSAVALVGASRSGNDVYFTTADPLVAQDTDTQIDIYDARVGGGLPVGQAPPKCQGDACQGILAPAPEVGAPQGSSAFSGPGNPLSPLVNPVSQPPTKPLTNAQKLARLLRACHIKHNKRKRKVCETDVRRRYGSAHKAHKAKRAATYRTASR